MEGGKAPTPRVRLGAGLTSPGARTFQSSGPRAGISQSSASGAGTSQSTLPGTGLSQPTGSALLPAWCSGCGGVSAAQRDASLLTMLTRQPGGQQAQGGQRSLRPGGRGGQQSLARGQGGSSASASGHDQVASAVTAADAPLHGVQRFVLDMSVPLPDHRVAEVRCLLGGAVSLEQTTVYGLFQFSLGNHEIGKLACAWATSTNYGSGKLACA